MSSCSLSRVVMVESQGQTRTHKFFFSAVLSALLLATDLICQGASRSQGKSYYSIRWPTYLFSNDYCLPGHKILFSLQSLYGGCLVTS